MENRTVIHVDLDAFYAQVESVRAGLSKSDPLGVGQHNMLIAASYSARPYGVNRGTSVEEAMRLCPHITIAYVPMIGKDGSAKPSLERYRRASEHVIESIERRMDEWVGHGCAQCSALFMSTLMEEAPHELGVSATIEPIQVTRCTKHTTASAEARRLNMPPKLDGMAVERASVDELYIDVSMPVDTMMNVLESSACRPSWRSVGIVLHPSATETDGDEEAPMPIDAYATPKDISEHEASPLACGAHVTSPSDARDSEAHRIDAGSFEARLWCTAKLAHDLRRYVYSCTMYTMSAGVAQNKLMAKLGSAMNKPDNQTVLRPGAVALEHHKLKKISGMGGKFGRQVAAWLETKLGALKVDQHWKVSDMLTFSRDELRREFGEERGEWLYNIVRGVDHREVVQRNRVQSVTCYKQFSATNDEAFVSKWLHQLIVELCDRLRDDQRRQRRVVTKINVSFTISRVGVGNRRMPGQLRSRVVPLPARLQAPNVAGGDERGDAEQRGGDADALQNSTWPIVRKVIVDENNMISGIGVAATSFRKIDERAVDIRSAFANISAQATKGTTRTRSFYSDWADDDDDNDNNNAALNRRTDVIDVDDVEKLEEREYAREQYDVLRDERAESVSVSIASMSGRTVALETATSTSTASKSVTLHEFLNRSECGVEDTFLCDQCGHMIEATRRDEHADFHFAQRIANGDVPTQFTSERRDAPVAEATRSSDKGRVGAKKRRSSSKTQRRDESAKKQRTLQSFFGS